RPDSEPARALVDGAHVAQRRGLVLKRGDSMFVLLSVLCCTGALWLLTGFDRIDRVHALIVRPPRRLRPRLLLRTLCGVCAAWAAVAFLGVLGGLVVMGVCAVVWFRARRPRDQRLPVTADLPVVIALLSAGVRAGATVPGWVAAGSGGARGRLGAAVAAVAGRRRWGGAARGRLGTELSAVAERMRLGAAPTEAWSSPALPEPLLAVGRDLSRAAETGAPVADLLDRHTLDLRRVFRTRTVARVERLSVLVVAPLGLCFLPAFVLIGIVPMAAELLWSALR